MLLIAGSEALTTTLAVSGSTRSGSGTMLGLNMWIVQVDVVVGYVAHRTLAWAVTLRGEDTSHEVLATGPAPAVVGKMRS